MRDDFDLAQKYTTERGQILLTGIQALVRIPLDQHRADLARGLNTATFISGYQGSPLGTFDMALAQNQQLLSENDIVWVPGVNEDLAASAVWGSQEPLLGPLAAHDGVLGMWYGKGPGVDRSGDAFKHANFKGVAENGGGLALAGDDPMAKSSTLPTQVDPSFYDSQMPILYPGSIQEIIDLGLHGFALSRYSGLWVGFKIVTTMADALGTAEVGPERVMPVLPELMIDGTLWKHQQQPGLVTPHSLGQEKDIVYGRLEAAKAYAAANGLNEITGASTGAWLGIAAAGRTFQELRQSLTDLGLDDNQLRRYGIRLLRLGMVWPLEPTIVHEFAEGLDEILVLDEKRSFIELFTRDILYGRTNAPRIVGKEDENGRRLVPADGELTADRIAPVLVDRLRAKVTSPVVEARLAIIESSLRAEAPELSRAPYWCSGCPHNRSTTLPEGSYAGGGVGCHAMSLWIDDRALTIHHMGGEGATWIGRAPFTDRTHMFQNIGDGTFFHSGSLAIRAAVAARSNITYKILYNSAVAMTGGQDIAGVMAIPELADALIAEGVSRIIVCSEEPERYRPGALADRTLVWHRDRLDDAQRELRDIAGVTVLIYDQQCAAEKRRDRKRGTLATPAKRIFINEAVCEGCGDCGEKSHCLSVQPVQTEFGAKTQIHQSSCNFDYTCIEGDCPSFVEVETGPAKKRRSPAVRPIPDELPEPVRPSIAEAGHSLYMMGVGGTGVVTVSQVVATAAVLEGLEVSGLDQTGLSQKGGPVVSHLRLFEGGAHGSNLIGAGLADCYLGFDILVAADPRNLARATSDRTIAAVSTSQVPTGDMVTDVHLHFPDEDGLLESIERATRKDDDVFLDALSLAEELFGNHLQANFLVLGAAYQAGGLPISATAIEKAIELNGVAVDVNKAAFRWGRYHKINPEAVRNATEQPRTGSQSVTSSKRARTHAATLIAKSTITGELAALVEGRAADLVDFQSAALADDYVQFVSRVAAREAEVISNSTDFATAVATYLYKLTAYKDEYEVARLYLRTEFETALNDSIPGAQGYRILLHPPLLRSIGRKKKIRFGPASRHSLRPLRAMRRLRGTPFDPFGRAAVRRLERELIGEYRTIVEEEVADLAPSTHGRAIRLAEAPDIVRGYEQIKVANVARFRDLVDNIRNPVPTAVELTTKSTMSDEAVIHDR